MGKCITAESTELYEDLAAGSKELYETSVDKGKALSKKLYDYLPQWR
jgi:hypothetical protein